MQHMKEDSDLDFQPLLIKELANKTTTIIKYIQKQKKNQTNIHIVSFRIHYCLSLVPTK